MYVAMCCKSKSGVQCNTVIILGMKIWKINFLFISLVLPCPHLRLSRMNGFQSELSRVKGFEIVSGNWECPPGDQFSACQLSVHA